MTKLGNRRNDLAPRIADQVECIMDAFDKQKPDVDIEIANGGIGYMYAERQLLVRSEYLDRVWRILWPRDESGEVPEEFVQVPDDPGIVHPVIAGVVLLRLSEKHPTVPTALNRIDEQLGAGIATPNHVLTVANGETDSCPATEPQEVYARIEPYPSACPGNGGAGVRIYMADTGFLEGADISHPWLAGVTYGPEDLEKLPPRWTENGHVIQPLPPYTGHGTFVAGVARCMAPGADITVINAFKIAGSTLESDLVERLGAAFGLGVDIFHLTIAAPSRKDLPLIAFEAWLKRMRQYKGVVCVVAAGNSHSRRPSWPAAFSEVVSVGALAEDWRSRASFSNYGGWVDVYAPGRDLVNAYATGRYTCYVVPYKGRVREFYGMAKWSGTSFSTPVVTGLIAARMSRTGENGQEAAAALLAEARRQAIPGVGPILLPRCDGDCREPGGRRGCGFDGRCGGVTGTGCGCRDR
jgi:hypothetical protein